MARLDFKLEHHQPIDAAQARFEAGIDEAVSRYRSWIDRVEWSEDGQAATIAGSGYEVRLWYDEHWLHVQGHVPLAWKLFEGAVRHRIREMIARPVERA
jgi:hypothetical protein